MDRSPAAPSASTTFTFKVVVLGDRGSGKNCLLARLSRGASAGKTLDASEVSYCEQKFSIGGKTVELQVSKPGQSYYEIDPLQYRANGAIICFDVTNKRSFENVPQWLTNAKKLGLPDAVRLLCACKCDEVQGRCVAESEIKKFCESPKGGVRYIETSAVRNTGVSLLFETMAATLISKQLFLLEKPKGPVAKPAAKATTTAPVTHFFGATKPSAPSGKPKHLSPEEQVAQKQSEWLTTQLALIEKENHHREFMRMVAMGATAEYSHLVGKEMPEELAQALRSCRSLHTLTVRNPQLGSGLIEVCAVVNANESIKRLRIEESKAPVPNEAWLALGKALQTRGLHELCVSNTAISENLPALIENHSLQSLRVLTLAHTSLKPAMVGKLCESLIVCAHQLTELSLCGNGDSQNSQSWNDVMPSLAAMVVAFRNTLSKLDLSSCGITHLGVFSLAVGHCRLTHLSVFGNAIVEESLTVLFDSLRLNCSLQDLHLPAVSDPLLTQLRLVLEYNFTLRAVTFDEGRRPEIDLILANHLFDSNKGLPNTPLSLALVSARTLERYLLFFAREDMEPLLSNSGNIFEVLRAIMQPCLLPEDLRQRWSTLLCESAETDVAPEIPMTASLRMVRKLPVVPSIAGPVSKLPYKGPRFIPQLKKGLGSSKGL